MAAVPQADLLVVASGKGYAGMPAPVAYATALALTITGSTTTGDTATVNVTPNGPIPPGGGTATLAITSGGGTLGSTSIALVAGSSGPFTTTISRSANGTTNVSLSNNLGLSNSPASASYTSTSEAWTVADGATVTGDPGTTTVLNTAVPVGAEAWASPRLPAGQSLAIVGSELRLVRAANAPALNGASSGSALDVMSSRATAITLLTSPYATIQNATKGITYQPAAGLWNTVMAAAAAGDTILISPGYVHQSDADLVNYYSGLDSCLLAVIKPLTISNMPGLGRWRPYKGSTQLGSDKNGIVIFAPGDGADIMAPGSFVIEGFELDNWGETASASGVKIRTKGYTVGSWAHMHTAVTLRNFSIGKAPYYKSASGINGAARTLLLDDGEVYDTGDGVGGAAGNDHNAYVSAETFTARGVRFQRSRASSADGSDVMDGHLLKVSAVNGLIEGCSLDADPLNGDNTHAVQMKAGGNFTIRGCLVRDSVRNNSAGRGMLNMCREYAVDGVTPNFEWWAGRDGNSLTVERCTFVGHYGRAAVWFFPSGSAQYMGPGSGTDQIASVTVRDNVGMIAATPTASAPFSQAKWIGNDPTGGADWATRGNTVVPYSADEAAFIERELLQYRLAAGPVAATGGMLATRRPLYPHGSMARNDAVRGLG